ncbi:hypothetical protein V8F20_011887 [Naviculisporaceae sp. PSN 640]
MRPMALVNAMFLLDWVLSSPRPDCAPASPVSPPSSPHQSSLINLPKFQPEAQPHLSTSRSSVQATRPAGVGLEMRSSREACASHPVNRRRGSASGIALHCIENLSSKPVPDLLEPLGSCFPCFSENYPVLAVQLMVFR